MSIKPRVRPGDLVRDRDIIRYKDPTHEACQGKGWGEDGELCDCARSRFLDANIFNVWPDANLDALRWGPDGAKEVGFVGGLDDFLKDIQHEMKGTDKKIHEAETETREFKKAVKNARAVFAWNLRGKAANDDVEGREIRLPTLDDQKK